MSYKRIEEFRMADDYETAENFAQTRAIMAPLRVRAMIAVELGALSLSVATGLSP